MVRDIKRADVKEVLREFKSGNFSKSEMPNGKHILGVWCCNTGSSCIDVGQPFGITGIMGSPKTSSDLYSQYLNYGPCLEGNSGSPSSIVAIANETIATNAVGKVILNGVVGAYVKTTNVNYKYATAIGGNIVTKALGKWRIIGRALSEAEQREDLTEDDDGNYVGEDGSIYIGNEGDLATSENVFAIVCSIENEIEFGHVTGTVIDGNRVKINYNLIETSTNEFTGDDGTVPLYCPLLRRGESIAIGTVVVLSYNVNFCRWEVTQAQCPKE